MHPPLPPPILSTVRLFADHAPTLLSLFILSNSRSRAILVESSKYLKILRLFFTYNRSESHSFYLEYFFLFFLFFEIEQDLRVRRHFEKKRSAASFACSKKKRDPRRYVPRVYEEGSTRERGRSISSSEIDDVERCLGEREKGEEKKR